jgi:hypothetical protein
MEVVGACKTYLTTYQTSWCHSIRHQSSDIPLPELSYAQTPYATRDSVPAVVATNRNMILMFIFNAYFVQLREKVRVFYWLVRHDVSRCSVPYSRVTGAERDDRRM